jgi:hypothetical protein
MAAVVVLAVCSVGYLWTARMLFLDDTFIHLRIARNLHDFGFYSFNGDLASYCTSSPLYTALLATLLTVFSGPLVPKIMGTLIYGALFMLVARSALSAKCERAQWLWLAFLAAIASPIGVRWLCDGMETGLVGLVAVVLAGVAFSISSGLPGSNLLIVSRVLLGIAAVMLRVEFLLLVALIGLASLVERRGRLTASPVSLALGAAIGLGLIYAVFGDILPDTAVAKAATGPVTLSSLLSTWVDVAKAHGAASYLGGSVGAAWLYSAAVVVRQRRLKSYSVILNAALPVFLLAIALRQQAIQGYRYFVFIEFFLLAYNIQVIAAEPGPEPEPAARTTMPRRAGWMFMTGIALTAAWQAVDFHRFSIMVASRAASFSTFSQTDFADVKGTYGIAWDVGLIGFFTDARILDVNGLVNGRQVARMAKADRLSWYVTHHPIKFVFGDAGQLNELRDLIDLRSWILKEQFDFRNFNGQPDVHLMLVRPE